MSDQDAGRDQLDLDDVFPRIDKRALGVAVGLTTGVAVWLLTTIRMATGPGGLPLGLLRQYLYGYSVTWAGACVGFAWGCAGGFVGGWLLGFVHNLTLDAWMLVVRTRTDLSQKRNLPDHIR